MATASELHYREAEDLACRLFVFPTAWNGARRTNMRAGAVGTNERDEMRIVIAMLAGLGCCASGAQDQDKYSVYEMQYELAELQLIHKADLAQGAEVLRGL